MSRARPCFFDGGVKKTGAPPWNGPPPAGVDRAGDKALPDWFAPALGTIAGLCSTFSFAPQVLKAWREGTRTISRRMYIVTVTAFILWICYGLTIASIPIIVFNSLSLLLSGAILALKWRDWPGREAAAEVRRAPAE